MPDIIQLLPENVANQIAAGEVVQRPASVVKELLENSVDAGATVIKLLVKDAGKTLVQVTDNGSGMSDTDARMSFERHATSKIRKSDDLFHIVTKGFRGEALASVAAVAQVELRTRQRGETVGTRIEIEGSKVKLQETCATPEGTTLMVKNLFFNVPARRYFLKSDNIELKHITDEFLRVAITHPEISFSMAHNDAEMFNLPQSNLRQRIVHVFGHRYNEKLVPVDEQTDIVKVSGFVGKPESARKNRGEQFFFANKRYIRNTYLHHAIMSAFEKLIPHGNFPLYIIYLELDPAFIDINIHPTKTEIKFQDERSVYAILHAAVRRAIGRFSLSPSLDFETETAVNVPPPTSRTSLVHPHIKLNPDYNPFENEREKSVLRPRAPQPVSGWKELMEIALDKQTAPEAEAEKQTALELQADDDAPVFQFQRRFIVQPHAEGLLIVDQRRAHRRILFEQYLQMLQGRQGATQQLLFPHEITFAESQAHLLEALSEAMRLMGFELEEKNALQWHITGVPASAAQSDLEGLVDELLEDLSLETAQTNENRAEQLAWTMARHTCLAPEQILGTDEMRHIIRQLFRCRMPSFAERQKHTFQLISLDQLHRLFG